MQMKKTVNYIDDLINKQRLRRDVDVARILNVSRARVSTYRTGGSMSPHVCLKLAILLNKNPLELIAVAGYEQSRNDEEKSFWIKIFEENCT